MATRGVRNSRFNRVRFNRVPFNRVRFNRVRFNRVAYAGAAVCFTLAALAGAVAAAAASTTPVVSVSVRDFAFVPNSITIVRGTEVRFTNTGNALHHVVSDDGSFDSHPLQPGHNVTFQFATLGVFHLHCDIHPTMTMIVTVVASQAATSTGGGGSSGTTKSASPATPTSLPRTGAGTTMMAILGLGLILLGMLCLAMGRSTAPIPAMVAAPAGPAAATIARVMGWENRFDDLLPRPRRE